jgi:hypothetical protein
MKHLATHKPKLKSCDTCRRAKALRVKRIRKDKAQERIRKSKSPAPENFGDQVALGHIIARNIRNLGFRGQTASRTLVDRATGFECGKGRKQKTGAANLVVMQRFQGRDDKGEIKYVWSDAPPEIIYAAAKLGIRGNHDASIPGDSQSDGIAENNNRDIKMGTASLLAHAGVPLAYWPLALPCYCFGRNVAIADGTSPYCKRFGGNFDQSKMFPFGGEVRFVPSKIPGDPRLHFDATTQPGIFLGCGSMCVARHVFCGTREGVLKHEYHTGRTKDASKLIVIQMVRDVHRIDVAKDAKFSFPLRGHYDRAFDAPEGWLDSTWREKPTMCQATASSTERAEIVDDVLRALDAGQRRPGQSAR